MGMCIAYNVCWRCCVSSFMFVESGGSCCPIVVRPLVSGCDKGTALTKTRGFVRPSAFAEAVCSVLCLSWAYRYLAALWHDFWHFTVLTNDVEQ